MPDQSSRADDPTSTRTYFVMLNNHIIKYKFKKFQQLLFCAIQQM